MSGSQPVIGGRFRLLQAIGGGGMGRVWLAFDEILCRQVAIKQMLPPPGLTDPQRERLGEMAYREAQAAAQVDHPGVVKTYDIVPSGQWPWIVMQYVPSQSLRDLIRVQGPLNPYYVAQLAQALLDALNAIHCAGVLHRDITPDNVLVGRDGRVMLADFGVALWLGDGEHDATELMGTAQFVAPERVIHGESTTAGDLWSLGATLYAATEGRSPYARPSLAETLSALASLPPDGPTRSGPLTPLVLGLLEREPRLRLTVAEARAIVEPLIVRGGQSSLRHPSSRPATATRPLTSAGDVSAGR